ncbi:MAG: MBL fold metallo-hydrolase [Chitinivibrionales bacterium]|nr:MBL fold metallo-hydrolase [Chitinivibrionales bacterium]MBD3357174.1 MBL fold metallo-hydrolase [Chitinivibrionales bacterium]
MKVTWWGVRGSVPVPGKDTVAFGGNTACVSVEFGERIVIFDAGTGIRACGNYLLAKHKPVEATIFISHTHWDHIQGFPFFVPAYIPGNRFVIGGPVSDVGGKTIRQAMELQTRYEHFPVRIEQLGARIEYVDCTEGIIEEERPTITACRVNHPATCLAYRIEHEGKVFVYGGDHEPYRNVYRDGDNGEEIDEEFLTELDANVEEQNRKIVDFCSGADLISWDAQYTKDEYRNKIGWGHGWYEYNMEFAQKTCAGHIVFTHHDPARTDAQLNEYEKRLRPSADINGFNLDFAREGLVVEI